METSCYGPLACSAAAENQPSSSVSSPVQLQLAELPDLMARPDGRCVRDAMGRVIVEDGMARMLLDMGAAGAGGLSRVSCSSATAATGQARPKQRVLKSTSRRRPQRKVIVFMHECGTRFVGFALFCSPACSLTTSRSGLYTHTDRRHALTLAHIRSTTRQRTMHTFARKVTRPLPSKGHVVLARLRDVSVASSMRNRCEFAWLVFASAVCRSTGSFVSDHIYPCVSDEIRQVTPDG